MDFYDVKTRTKVNVPGIRVRKEKYTTKNGQVRYALRGYTEDNRNFVKFVSKDVWDSFDESEEYVNKTEKKYLEERAARADLAKFEAVLKKIRSIEPDEEDKWQ